MTERVLTVDLGNTRCKLVGFASPPRESSAHAGAAPDDAARVVGETAFVTGPALAREVQAWLAGEPRYDRCVLSAVASPALEDELAQALTQTFGARFARQPDVGLVLDVHHPETVGRDRLYAARGAFDLVHGPAIVVDAGTALTVDAVAVDARGRGVFRGGSIAPGPRLLADALARHAARLPRIDPEPGAAALGLDTHGALQSGVVVGFRGAAAHLAREIARETGLVGCPVVVTGGARAYLLEPTPCFESRVIVDPLSVHRGLLAAAFDPR